MRNEDHAAVYRGTLHAIISDEHIASKVSDMMPTVPGHPHQIPVGKRITKPLLKTESTVKSSSEEKKPQTKEENVILENGENNEKKEQKKVEENEATNSSHVPTLPLDEATPALSLDLKSPTTPLPMEVINHPLSPESVPSESAYATPQTSPQKLRKTLKEESLPWLYFAVFDGHAGQSSISLFSSLV